MPENSEPTWRLKIPGCCVVAIMLMTACVTAFSAKANAQYRPASSINESGTVSSNRQTPLVRAVAKAQASVVNIRGQKSVRKTNSLAISTGTSKQVNGMGTGVVIDPRGYILTNYHVVQDVRQIKVTTFERKTMVAELIAHDEATDLAIIKIKPRTPLIPISVGSSKDIMLGESVAAIGNAYGYEHTLTVGIVSALKRQVQVSEDQVYEDLIQTDTAINPGNSGGPLINMDGEMIGVNVAVRVNAQGIAFAIPVNDVMSIADKLLSRIVSERINAGMKSKTVYMKNKPVIVVESVDANGPAAAAGIKVGDQIARVDGQNCFRAVDVQTQMLDRQPGQQLKLALVSSNQGEREVSLKLGSPSITDAMLIWNRVGVRFATVDRRVMRQLSDGFDAGLQVVQIRSGSPAHMANINKGDIIVAMDGWKTESTQNVSYILNQKHIAQKNPFEYYLFRGKQPVTGKMRVGDKAR